eukprot:14829_3
MVGKSTRRVRKQWVECCSDMCLHRQQARFCHYALDCGVEIRDGFQSGLVSYFGVCKRTTTAKQANKARQTQILSCITHIISILLSFFLSF